MPSTSKIIPFNLGKSCPCFASGFKGANFFGFRFFDLSPYVDGSEADMIVVENDRSVNFGARDRDLMKLYLVVCDLMQGVENSEGSRQVGCTVFRGMRWR